MFAADSGMNLKVCICIVVGLKKKKKEEQKPKKQPQVLKQIGSSWCEIPKQTTTSVFTGR